MATTPQAVTRRDLETRLIEKAWKDPDFRKEIVKDPKGMFERHTGQKLPVEMKIYVHEEDANTLHFSIPPAPSNMTELSDQDLERVAGGTDFLLPLTAVTVSLVLGTAAGSIAGGAVVTVQKGW